MRKQGNNETFQSGSRIPRASLSTSMHKPSLSESIKAPSKLSSSKLNINLSLLHPSRNKIPPSSASTTKRNLLLTNRKEEDSMIMKQSLNTVKSTLKKFDLRSKTLNSSLLSHSRFRWEEMKTPASLSEVLSNFAEVIPQWEQEEIKGYCEIYYIGKSFKPKDPEFDDEHGDYKIKIKDHIGFRYEIIGMIGKGSFGQVIEVFDHCEKKTMALKIIKNKERFNQQAKVEVEVLEFIKLHDVQKTSNIIEIQDKFIFRNHMVTFT